jgi:hypothetical protein
LQHIKFATPAGIAPRVVGDVVPPDPREVSLLLRIGQGGDIVHSSVHALSAVLGEEMVHYVYDFGTHIAGLAFDFGDAPALVCRQHECFPESLSMPLCAVHSDGLVASVMPTTVFDCVGGYPFGPGPQFEQHYAANPTLETIAPVAHGVGLTKMFTATREVLPLSFVDTLVEAN